MAEEREVRIEPEAVAVEERPADMPVKKYNLMAQGFLQLIEEAGDLDDVSARESLYELMDQFAAQEHHSGDADDFHNFSVTLVRKSEYGLACRVLDCGLARFPGNVDLLADFLQYGVNCDRTAECKQYYKKLVRIPRRRWSWRGFAFLIEYLKYEMERSASEKEIAAKEAEMLSVVADFRAFYPYSEETYRVEANVYKALNRQDKELETLQTGLQLVKVAPKCALRCAEVLLERGRYAEAAETIARGIRDANQMQNNVNEGYSHYLRALCQIAMAQNSEKVLSETEVRSIYLDFNSALRKLKDASYVEIIKTKTNKLMDETQVEVPQEYKLLYDAMEVDRMR